jgi:polysaccharide export outer membrane protein
MRGVRLSIIVALACLACGCARQQPRYAMVDAATGQPVAPAQAPVAASRARGLLTAEWTGSTGFTRSTRSGERGLFSAMGGPAMGRPAAPAAQHAYYPSTVLQAPGPSSAQRSSVPVAPVPAARPAEPASQTYASAEYPASRPYAAYAAAPGVYQPPYTLDAGDKLRIVVFGQEGISSSYLVDAGGNVTLPLIGSVRARGLSTVQLAQSIAARLRQGYVRDPKVTAEVEVYRPFFILGEVTTPGQYPYSPNMTAETAVAIAGGFGPRASKSTVKVTRNAPGQQFSGDVPLNFPLRPGDTVVVKERWF